MKKFTTFLSVLALMLVSVAANAQSFANGDYFFQNVETGTWLGGANDWGTHASTVAHPQRFTLTKVSDGVYTLNSHTYNNANAHFLNGDFIDGASSNITIAPVEGKEGVYTLASGSNYYTASAQNTYVWQGADVDPTTSAAQWKIISEADMVKSLKLGETTDATFFIKGAAMSRNLYNASFEKAWDVSPNIGGDAKNSNAEKWGGNSQTFTSGQTIQVPNGKYKLSVQGFYRYNNTTGNTNDIAISSHADGTEVINSFLFANDEQAPLKSIADDDASAVLDKIPFSQGEASAAFNQGLYKTELEFTVTDGFLNLGVKKTTHPGCDWTVWDNFELTLVEYTPLLGEPEFTPADGSKMAPEELTSIKVSYPKAVVDEDLGFSVSAEWILEEDGNEIMSNNGAFDVTGLEIPVEAGVGHTYTLKVYPTLNRPDGTTADTREDAASVKTLNLTELAAAEYEDAVDEADEYLEYVQSHIGVGLMLYYPAVAKKYAENLEKAKYLAGGYSIYNDYKEGTDLIRSIMMECNPQYPNSNQRYLVQHKASKLYLNATDDAVTLNAAPTPVAFHHVEGAKEEATYYMYSTPDRKYIFAKSETEVALTGHTTKLALGQWCIKHNHETQAYNIVGANEMAIGANGGEAASPVSVNLKETDGNAQWLLIAYTEPEPSDDVLESGDYYIRNRESGKYLGGANSWGTQASLIEHGHAFTATLVNGEYTLDSHIYYNASNHFLGDAGYVDSGSTKLSIEPTKGGYYSISVGGKYYSAPAEGTVLALGDYADAKSEWEFITKDALLAEVAAGKSNDLTFLIKDPNFSRNCLSQETNPWDIAPAKGGDNTNQNAEKWGGNSQEFDSHQTVELPNGTYKLSVQGFYRYNNTTENTNQVAIDSHADGTEVINSYFYGNEVEQPLMSIADDAASEALGADLPFSQAAASAAFGKGLYQNSLIVEVKDGKLTIGVKKTSHPGCDWTVWDNFELTVASAADIALAAAIRNAAAAEATAITSASASSATPVAVYSANGAQVKSLQKGLNIVRMSDGQTKKVFIK